MGDGLEKGNAMGVTNAVIHTMAGFESFVPKDLGPIISATALES